MSAFTNYSEVEMRKAIFRTSTVNVRVSSAAYTVGDRMMLGTGDLNVYEAVLVTGNTTSPAPAFNTSIGQTTADGGVTWLACKQGLPKKQLFISLHTVLLSGGGVGELGTGTSEVTGGNYARVAVDPLDANWSAPDTVNGLTANVSDIVFNAPSGIWGTPVYSFGIWDRLTAGNMLFWGDLTTPKTVNNGDPAPRFPAGALTVTFA